MPQTLYFETVTITYNGMLIVIHIYASDLMFIVKTESITFVSFVTICDVHSSGSGFTMSIFYIIG